MNTQTRTQRVCENFKAGACPYGARCYFSHTQNSGHNPRLEVFFDQGGNSYAQPLTTTGNNVRNPRICKLFLESGSCHFGDRCHFAHTGGPPVCESVDPRQCRNWVMSGTCQHESFCGFLHDGWDPKPMVAPRPGCPSRDRLMEMTGAHAAVYKERVSMDELATYFRTVFRHNLVHPTGINEIVLHYAECYYRITQASPALLREVAGCGVPTEGFDAAHCAEWLEPRVGDEMCQALLQRYGISEALEKRRVCMERWSDKTHEDGMAFEALSITGDKDQLSECEKSVVTHLLAMMPRDEGDGRVSTYGSLPGKGPCSSSISPPRRRRDSWATSWPSQEDIEVWCEWVLRCRVEAAYDLEGFIRTCRTNGYPLILLVRNVVVTKRAHAVRDWTAEIDCVAIEVVSNTVLAVVEVKNGPWGLPKSIQQRNRFVRGLQTSTESLLFLHNDHNCRTLLLTFEAFSLFCQQPDFRWITASHYRDVEPGEKPRSGMQPNQRRTAYEAVAHAIIPFGYVPGMPLEELHKVAEAFLSDTDTVHSIARHVRKKWQEECEANRLLRPPEFSVKECLRLGCWNLILWDTKASA